MLTEEFNKLSLSERGKLVFGAGKLINIYDDNKLQKVFYYKLGELKIDVIYDKVNNRLLDIIAWDESKERVDFLKMPVYDDIVGES
jgi:hypothetical protein